MKSIFFIYIFLISLLFITGCESDPSNTPFDNGGPYLQEVTFNVDMNAEITNNSFNPNEDKLDVPGNQNDWSNSDFLSDDDEDGIYSITYNDFLVGYVFEYKFRINEDWDTSEFQGSGNRFYTVISGNNTISQIYNG